VHSKSIDVNMSYSFFNIFHENFHHEGRVCEGKSNKDTQLLYLVDLALACGHSEGAKRLTIPKTFCYKVQLCSYVLHHSPTRASFPAS
jgi:hypothetical protein